MQSKIGKLVSLRRDILVWIVCNFVRRDISLPDHKHVDFVEPSRREYIRGREHDNEGEEVEWRLVRKQSIRFHTLDGGHGASKHGLHHLNLSKNLTKRKTDGPQRQHLR